MYVWYTYRSHLVVLLLIPAVLSYLKYVVALMMIPTFSLFWLFLTHAYFMCAEIIDRDKIVNRTCKFFDTLDFYIDPNDSSDFFDNFER